MMRPLTILCAVLCLCAPLALAQDADPDRFARRSYTTAHRGEASIDFDGRPTEPAWDLVPWAGDFIGYDPEEGAPPAQETEFKILYDDDSIWFAARAWDTEPALIEDILARRDRFPGDWVEINIDSYHDARTAFSFTSSVSGTRGDEFVSNDGTDWNGNWDPVWEVRTNIDEHGWTLEARIPLSQLRFSNASSQIWGFQVMRRVYRAEQRSVFQPKPKDAPGWVSHFAELRGLEGLRPKRRIELMPYVLGKGETFREQVGNPFRDGSDGDGSLGLDGKVGLTNDLTLDFTLNPDFGQVEADPSQVNLTAFETFFGERRPFFIEGNNIFNWRLAPSVAGGPFTSDRLFYSRRVGRSPRYSPDLASNEFADQPANTSILGAAKLSGKTASGISIGIIEAVTAEERAVIEGPNGRREEVVEPLTNSFVGRLQKDFRRGDTRIGGMLTSVNRNIDRDELAFLHEQAYAGGLDFHHRTDDRRWSLGVNLSRSLVRGDESALLRTQTSSARYYQRPDNGAASVDSTATSLAGHGGSVRLGHTSDGPFRFEVATAWRSPGYEINDAGFLRRANEINEAAWMGYHINRPIGPFRSLRFNANQWLNWDFDGVNLSKQFNANMNANTNNNWRFGFGVTRQLEFVSNTALRGGPSSRWPGDTNFNLWVNGDGRKRVAVGFGGFASLGDDDSGSFREGWFDVDFRPSNALTISLFNFYNQNRPALQYVGTRDFQGEDRYLFGELEQDTYGVTLRVDYSLTPNLTLQYYGSPFLSAGRYDRFKRITDPQASRFADRYAEFGAGEIAYDEASGSYRIDEDGGGSDYELDDPNFDFRDFNSNFVLRWEFDPGSALFVVWSQARQGFGPRGELSVGDDLRSLFEEHPHDVLLIKVAKWFSL